VRIKCQDFRRADPWILGKPGKVLLARIPGNKPGWKPAVAAALEADGRAVAGRKLALTRKTEPPLDVWNLSPERLTAIIKEKASRQGDLTILLHDDEWRTPQQKQKLADAISALNKGKYQFAPLSAQGNRPTCAGASTGES
jgi:hypothetical protein